jgi:hypothetical protein
MQIMQPNRMILEYLLETLQDNYDELEDRYGALRTQSRRNCKQLDLLRKDHEHVRREFSLTQESLIHKTRLIEQHGLRLPINRIVHRSTSSCHRISRSISGDFVAPQQATANVLATSGQHEPQSITNGHRTVECSPIDSTGSYGKCKNPARPNYPPPPPPINGHGSDSGFASMNGQLTNGSGDTCSSRNGNATGKPPAPLPVSPDSGMESEDQQPFLSSSAFVQQVNGQLLSSTNGFVKSSLSNQHDSSSHQPQHLLFTPEMAGFLQRIEGTGLNEKLRTLLHSNQERREQAKALRSKLNDEKIRSIKLEALSLLDHRQNGLSSARTRGSAHRKYLALLMSTAKFACFSDHPNKSHNSCLPLALATASFTPSIVNSRFREQVF